MFVLFLCKCLGTQAWRRWCEKPTGTWNRHYQHTLLVHWRSKLYQQKEYLIPLESLKSSFCWLEEEDNSTEAETPNSEKSSSFAKRRLFCKDTFLLMPKMFRKLNPEMNFVFRSFSRKASQLSKFRSWSSASGNQGPGPDLIKIFSE